MRALLARKVVDGVRGKEAAGAELFNGNVALCGAAGLAGREFSAGVARNWLLSFVGTKHCGQPPCCCSGDRRGDVDEPVGGDGDGGGGDHEGVGLLAGVLARRRRQMARLPLHVDGNKGVLL